MRALTSCFIGLLLCSACSSESPGPEPAGTSMAGSGVTDGIANPAAGGSEGVVPAPGSAGSTSGGEAGSTAGASTGGEATTPPDSPDQTPSFSGAGVMSWVPPYSVEECQAALTQDFGGIGMKDGLSRLGLQFWRINGASTELDSVSEDDVRWFTTWGAENGVGILLTLHNHVNGDWNWPEALRGYRDNREALVAHLLAEIERFDLDGIDLDLEGIVDPTPSDTEAFYTFARDLADGLHPLGKRITVASFHGMWNAPNWNWWPTLLTFVDGIESMGYDQSGMNVDFAELVSHASAAPEKLMIGVPSYVGTWQGNTATEHLDWLVEQGEVGVSIWDAALNDPAWESAEVWQRVAQIKGRTTP